MANDNGHNNMGEETQQIQRWEISGQYIRGQINLDEFNRLERDYEDNYGTAMLTLIRDSREQSSDTSSSSNGNGK